jgi:hypothetical protein
METDAAMLAVLSIAVAALGIAGWWVLAIGAMRYGYVAMSPSCRHYGPSCPLAIQRKSLRWSGCRSDRRPDFGLTHGQHWVPTIFLLAALGLLCWSFSCDVIVQLRRSL